MSMAETVLQADPNQRPALDISLVQRHLIPAIWPRIQVMLQKAADLSIGRYDLEDVRQKLVNDLDWHLFVIFEPDLTVVAAVIASFSYYPKGKFLCAQFAGGDRLEDWRDSFFAMFDSWGRDNGCTMIEIGGRPGWKKITARYGYEEAYRVFQKEL